MTIEERGFLRYHLGMNVDQVMAQLETMGSEQTRKTFRNHGAPESMFGVKVGDMKTIVKKVKTDQALAEGLYATGNSDAMYLAGLIADPSAMSPDLLDRWARAATWHMLSESTVAWVAAESPHGWEMGLRWIDDPEPHVASSGWATLADVAALRPDEKIDLDAVRGLLERVRREIHSAPNRVRYTMNTFVIAVGCYVSPLSAEARRIGEALGPVEVHLGNTACKVPSAPERIDKAAGAGKIGQKRKTVRC